MTSKLHYNSVTQKLQMTKPNVSACNLCYPNWTPWQLSVTFSGITICGCSHVPGESDSYKFILNVDMNQTWLLTQQSDDFCKWRCFIANAVTVRHYSTENCTGTFTELPADIWILVNKVTYNYTRIAVRVLANGSPPSTDFATPLLFHSLRYPTPYTGCLDTTDDPTLLTDCTLTAESGLDHIAYGGTATILERYWAESPEAEPGPILRLQMSPDAIPCPACINSSHTPKNVTVKFSDITYCTDCFDVSAAPDGSYKFIFNIDINQTWLLTQKADNACIWEYIIPNAVTVKHYATADCTGSFDETIKDIVLQAIGDTLAPITEALVSWAGSYLNNFYLFDSGNRMETNCLNGLNIPNSYSECLVSLLTSCLVIAYGGTVDVREIE